MAVVNCMPNGSPIFINDQAQTQGVNVGSVIKFNTPGQVTALKMYKTANSTGIIDLTLYDQNGNAVAATTYDSAQGGVGHMNVPLAVPYTPVQGQWYCVSVHYPPVPGGTDLYALISSTYLNTVRRSPGNEIQSLVSGGSDTYMGSNRNGLYSYGAKALPTTPAPSHELYGADVQYDAVGTAQVSFAAQNYAYGFDKAASSTTIATTQAGTISSLTTGDVLLAVVSFDNLTLTTPTLTGMSQTGATVDWTIYNCDAISGTAAGCAKMGIAIGEITSGFPQGSGITATLSAAVLARAIYVIGLPGADKSSIKFLGSTPQTMNGLVSSSPTTSLVMPDMGVLVDLYVSEENTYPTTGSESVRSNFTYKGIYTTGGGSAANVACGMSAFFAVNQGATLTYSHTLVDGAWAQITLAPKISVPVSTPVAVSDTVAVSVTDAPLSKFQMTAVALTDTVTVAVNDVRSMATVAVPLVDAPSISVTDVSATLGTTTRTDTVTVAVGDVQSLVQITYKNLTDTATVSVTDTQATQNMVTAVNLSDTVTVAVVDARTTLGTDSLDDAITVAVGDVIAGSSTATLTDTTTVAAGDSQATAKTQLIAVTDTTTVSVADSQSTVQTTAIALTDTVGVAVTDVVGTPSVAVTLSDSPTIAVTDLLAGSSTGTLTDLTTVDVGDSIVLPMTSDLTDTVALSVDEVLITESPSAPVTWRNWTLTGNSKTSGTATSLATRTGTDYPQVGDTIIVALTMDNLTVTTPILSSVADAGGTGAVGAWTIRNIDATTATAAGAAPLSYAFATVTSAFGSADTINTTLSASVAARAGLAIAYSGSQVPVIYGGAPINGAATTNGQGAGQVAGDITVALASNESNATGLTGGSGYTSRATSATSGSSAQTNVFVQAVELDYGDSVSWSLVDGATAYIALEPFPAGTTLVNIDDTLTVQVDDQQAVQSIAGATPINVSDSVTVAVVDSSATYATATLTDTDTIAVGDTQATAKTQNVTLTDTPAVAVADSITGTGTSSLVDSATVNVGDVRTQASTTALVDTTTVAVTDSQATTQSNTYALTDTVAVTVTDAQNLQSGTNPSIFDTVTVAVGDVLTFFSTIALSDSVVVAVNDAQVSTAAFTLTDTDTVSVADTRIQAASTAVSDAVGVVVTDNRSQAATIALSDVPSVSVADSSAHTVQMALTDAPNVSVADSRATANTFALVDVTTVSLADSQSITSVQAINLSDSVTVAVVEGTFTTTSAQTVALTDAVTVSLADTQTTGMTVALTDAIGVVLTEAGNTAATIARTDAVQVAVSDVSGTLGARAATDNVGIAVADSIGAAMPIAVADTTALRVADRLVVIMPGGLNDHIRVGEDGADDMFVGIEPMIYVYIGTTKVV